MPRAAHLQPHPQRLDVPPALLCTVQFVRPTDPDGHPEAVAFMSPVTLIHTPLFPWPASVLSLLVNGGVLNLLRRSIVFAVRLFYFVQHTLFHSFTFVLESKLTHLMYSTVFVVLMPYLYKTIFLSESAGPSLNACWPRIYQTILMPVQHHTSGYLVPRMPSRQVYLSRMHQGLIVMFGDACHSLGIRLHILSLSHASWPH